MDHCLHNDSNANSTWLLPCFQLHATVIPDLFVTFISHSITSFAVIANLLSDLKILNSELGRLALSTALVSDMLSTCMTSLGTGIVRRLYERQKIMTNILSLFAFFVLIPLLFRPAMRWIIRQTPQGRPVKEAYIYSIIAMVLCMGMLAILLDQEFYLGAFILGLAVPEGAPLGTALVKKLELFGTWFLLPVFVTTCMMKADLSLECTKLSIWIVSSFVLGAHLVKMIACLVLALWCKMSKKDSLALAIILNCKGVVEVCSYNAMYDKKCKLQIFGANCMASNLGPSSSILIFNTLRSEPYLTRKFNDFPGKIWGSRIFSGITARKHFHVKSSNGHPLNAISSQDGLPGSPLAKEHIKPQLVEESFPVSGSECVESNLSITVVGASGDLAKKKIFPALFALYYEDCLPENFIVFGYARTKMTNEDLRTMISETLTCRIDKRENCDDKMAQFLSRCFYHSGQYNSEEDFLKLDCKLKEKEGEKLSNRLYYLSIPPNIFVDVVRCASMKASSEKGWTRVIVEKPFGRDSESSSELTRCLKQYLTEDQIFRIDHYLGKELVENLSVLRFSNLVFEPLWSRNYIRNVQIIFSEDFGTEGRGGYFDHYGIIRDIIQNHLLQILALFAMETPVSLDAEDVRNEKVKVLRSMRPLRLEDVVVGQYKGHSKGGRSYPGYTDDSTVPSGSLTPTFAAAALFINNARWDGVPFLMKAGKALHTKRAEIRVQFRHVPGNLYKRNFGTDLDKATNELVLRVQPDEAIYLKINNKVPGLGMRLDRSDLNLLYRARYPKEIPDAYERLLLDAIEGERRLFIRSDELDAAWAIFTPLLKELENKKIAPELYPYGSRGPVGAHYLAARHNVRWGDLGSED
ncbi:hypothetical protein L6164_028994 [Bauhinia variegata]|uniref:Uncharacterized protein n=1 Tax=Bauhinia variegata TaxID=167791 RepID=A0ACB9L979_BAUVA|nr:hypothetical protein L6164_028994 [Bauhinia variegata]